MFPRPPSSTLTDTLFPNTALVRSPPLLHGQVGVRSLFIDSIENSRSHSLDCERTRRIQGLLSAVRRGARNAAHCVIVVMTAPYLRVDRKSTRLNSSHLCASRMPSSA